MVSKDELVQRLDDEIERAEASLRFWCQHEHVNDDTTAAIVCALIDGYKPHLKHLKAMRAGMTA